MNSYPSIHSAPIYLTTIWCNIFDVYFYVEGKSGARHDWKIGIDGRMVWGSLRRIHTAVIITAFGTIVSGPWWLSAMAAVKELKRVTLCLRR